MDGREPDIPVYKVTESLGPTNTRIYTVAVYFRGDRLATAKGTSTVYTRICWPRNNSIIIIMIIYFHNRAQYSRSRNERCSYGFRTIG